MTEESGWESGLGKAVSMRRGELEMARKDLAQRAGISYPYLCEIENGNKQPSNRKLGQLAEALNVNTADLVELAGRLNAAEPESSSILMGSDQPTASRPLHRERSHFIGISQPVTNAPPRDVAAAPFRLEDLDPLARQQLRAEIRSEAEEVVRDLFRIWTRDVLPLLVEREVARALDNRPKGKK